jgi:hypothetical protein
MYAQLVWVLMLLSSCSGQIDLLEPNYGLRTADKRLLVELSDRYSLLRQVKINLEAKSLACFDTRYIRQLDATTERISQLSGMDRAYSIATAIKEVNRLINSDDPDFFRVPDDEVELSTILAHVDISSGISNDDCSDMAILAYTNFAPAGSGQAWLAMRRGEPYEPSFNLANAVADVLSEDVLRKNEDLLGKDSTLSFERNPYQWWVAVEYDTSAPNGITEPQNQQKIIEITSAFLERGDLLDETTVLSIALTNVTYSEMIGGNPVVRAVFAPGFDETGPSASELIQRINKSWRAQDLVSKNLSSTLVLARMNTWLDRKSTVDELRDYLSAIDAETSTRLLVFQPAF